jgi:DUF1009 family protein
VEAVSNPAKLGIIAGRGDLPVRLVEAARATGREVYVLAIKNQVEQPLDGIPHDWIRLGAAGKALDLLRANGVVDLVFAGAVKRPSLGALMPDAPRSPAARSAMTGCCAPSSPNSRPRGFTWSEPTTCCAGW